jgi:hypothetical protein
MMVDYGDPVAGKKQVFGQNLFRAACIHHDKQRAGIGHDDGVLRGDEQVFIFRELPQPFDEISGKGML